MKRLFLASIFALVTGLSAPAAEAAAIVVPSAGEIVGTIVVLDADPLNPIYDVHGIASADVFQIPGFTPLGNGSLVGTSPTFPEDNLLFLNAGPTEFIEFTFLFPTSSIVGPTWTLFVSGSGAATDPVLTDFIALNNLAQFTFFDSSVLFGAEQQRIGQLFTFNLDFIASPQEVTPIPEPATLSLLGVGLAAVARRRMKRGRRA